MTSPIIDADSTRQKPHSSQVEAKIQTEGGGEAELHCHAYHQNLPPHYIDEDGISRVTKYAHRKARSIVRLVHSIRLTEDLFTTSSNDNSDPNDDPDNNDDEEEDFEGMDIDEEKNDDNEDGEEEFEWNGAKRRGGRDTLQRITKKCERVSTLMSSLETLKYGGITQEEMCFIVLHVLQLLTATITYTENEGDGEGEGEGGHYTLKFDTVGQLYKVQGQNENGDSSTTKPIPLFQNVGGTSTSTDDNTVDPNDYVKESFALPSPAREALLSFIIMILTKDRYLRPVSNQSFIIPQEQEQEQEQSESKNAEDENDTNVSNDGDDEYPSYSSTSSSSSLLLVIEWKALLRLLLRTAPYLDENRTSKPNHDSLSRQSTVLKRTISIIRYSRRFFNQGLEVKRNVLTDEAASEIWDMVYPDLINQTHSNACYRAVILLHLFFPTRCSSKFYVNIMPIWLQCWTSIDRCPEFDFLWINMFCRSRRFLKDGDYDWGPLRRRLLTLCGYWLQIPVGGRSSDKTFPRAAEARSRNIPSRLKTFVRSDSSYQEGVDFVAKVAKLLVFCCGKNDGLEEEVVLSSRSNETNADTVSSDNPTTIAVSHGTEDLLRFFSFVGPYFNPSNTGSWTFPLGVMLHYISFELCRRIGRDDSQATLTQTLPMLASTIAEVEPFKLNTRIPDHEIVLILDSILPLCQQALYSKSSHVSRAGEAALLYLVQIDYKICAPLLDFAMRALDISSVTQSHQAPAALSTMNRLILPSLRKSPSIFLERLPDILRLSLAGIDSNDEDKTIRTLVFYRTLTSWLPVGNEEKLVETVSSQKTGKDEWRFGEGGFMKITSHDIDSKAYWDSLKRLPKNSILFQKEDAQPLDQDSHEVRQRMINLAEEAGHAMADWSISFLDRIYGLFRAAGEQEKVGKSHRIATKHSSAADVAQARHFTRILKECLRQIFAAMDSESFICAINSVSNFLINETHPLAVKYASALCESIAATRADESDKNISPGFSNLVMPLTAELRTLSNNSVLYRIRCLAGAVRRAGVEVLNYREHVLKTLDFTFAHRDKRVFKAGCKLLRHTLSSQSESYPLATDSSPRVGMLFSLGESAQLNNDKTRWHVPSGEQINFVAKLLSIYVYDRIRNIPEYSEFVFVDSEMDGDNKISSKQEYIMEWRRCLRVLRYTIRGCPGLLIDMSNESEEPDVEPNEHAMKLLLDSAAPIAKSILLSSRERISRIIISLLSLIAKESSSHDTAIRISKNDSPRNMNVTTLIASDIKICKEVAEISQLLFARRSASFRSQDAFTVWKAQKDLTNDRVVLHHRKEIGAILQKAGCLSSTLFQTYSDGEEGGKLLPRRMVSNRVEIFLHSFQRSSSFEIPRRLRRERGLCSSSSTKLLSLDLDIESFKTTVCKLVDTDDSSAIVFTNQGDALDKYEAILDGMFALTCHNNSLVRGYGIRAAEYGFSRFGWLAQERVPRLLSAISLDDQQCEVEYGLISCSKLSLKDDPSLRKRLSEVLKGACLILVVPRVIKQIMASEEYRIKLVKALSGTQHIISLLPAEEMQKMLSYFHQIFSTFRSRFFSMPVMTKEHQTLHKASLSNLLDLVKEEKKDDTDVTSSLNWRNRLLVCWFVTTLADKIYFLYHEKSIIDQMWETCIFIIQTESGQPLQKVALGLLGRLVNISQHNVGSGQSTPSTPFHQKMIEEDFCSDFSKALVYNHKEDQSVGGGHHAQWSLGVSEIIRDAASNLAPKMMFPFLRVGRSNGHFKVTHVQLLNVILESMGSEAIGKTVDHLLSIAKDLAASPPSEDQRNQLCTSAEIFCGVFISLLNRQDNNINQLTICNKTLLPFLDNVIEIIPSSVLGAFLDALRYGMTKICHSLYESLCSWSIKKIENSLWRSEDIETSAVDGFAAQSKWLAVMNVILIQMDFQTDSTDHVSWDTRLSLGKIYSQQDADNNSPNGLLANSWDHVCSRLLPRLLDALGHPYQSCRERIASVLFRIARCYQSQGRYGENGDEMTNPRATIVNKILSLSESTDKFSKVHQHSLITSRLFLSYCVHHGEVKHEFANYIIPLLPLAFDAIKPSIDEDEAKEDDPEIRMLQAQVVKAYRHSISEISVSCTAAYGNPFDLSQVLKSLDQVSMDSVWQLRLAVAHFLRCFQGNHKFLFTTKQTKKTTKIVARLLADERREVSAVAMAALTGILAATPRSTVAALVDKYRKKANNSVMRKAKKKKMAQPILVPTESTEEEIVFAEEKEKERIVKQQTSVYFLCAAVLATPYETPPYVPVALAALSKHSYERSAPFAVRETVKMCCAEYKRTHRSDNWEIHRQQFTREQLEALDDVVSTPHYYA